MTDSGELIVSKDSLPTMDMTINGGNGYDPVNELMRAIILRTVEDYHAKGEFYQEAVDYMMSDDDEDDTYIFSFVGICRHLGLDPVKTRNAIMNATHRISTRRRAA